MNNKNLNITDNANENKIIKGKTLNLKKNLNDLDKIFARQIIDQSQLQIKSSKIDITIHSDSPDGYVNEKVNFALEKGKLNRIVKIFSLGGTSDKLHSFKISSSYDIFNINIAIEMLN